MKCIAAHLREFQGDSRSEIVFCIEGGQVSLATTCRHRHPLGLPTTLEEYVVELHQDDHNRSIHENRQCSTHPVYLVCHRLGTGLKFRCGLYVQPYSGSPANFVVYTTTQLLTRASWASACRVVDTCSTVTTQPRRRSPTLPSTSNLSSTKHPKRCKRKVLFATLAVSITAHSVRLVKPQLTFL